MKKRLLSALLALCMVLALLPGTAWAAGSNVAYPVTDGNIYFDTGILAGAITSCDKSVTSVNIPNEISGVPVTSIWEYAFAENKNLTSVTIPNSATYIARFAFQHCSNLSSINIPSGVTSIEWGTFAGCYSLTNITLPNGVTSIGAEAFYDCYNLTSIYIPASVVRMYDFAFNACISLADVYYGGSESQWQQIIFGNYGFESLNNATVHYNSTAIGADSVGDGIDVGSKGIIYPVTGGNLYFDASGGYIVDCDESVTEAIIPSEIYGVPVTMIANGAFKGCTNLTSVTIPPSVTMIHQHAFEDCTSLTNATILANITSIEELTFWDCPSLTTVTIPSSVTIVKNDAFGFANLKDVYYGGSESQWKQIEIRGTGGGPYSPLHNAAIHYNSTAPRFSDVPVGSWYADAVNWAVDNNITSGTGNGTFTPNRVCSHGEIITFLWRAAGKPASSVQAPVMTEPYDDFRNAANWAYEKGIIDSAFQTSANCTRASTVTYMWKAAGSPDAPAAGFPDVSSYADYAMAVNWALETGVTAGTGDGSVFSPDITCDRSQIVTFLQRAYA